MKKLHVIVTLNCLFGAAPILKTSPRNRPSQGGFALVIALSLMAFVLLLLLSITTLVQVETQSAQIQSSQMEAKQNALLGLQQALGTLQKSMGPDQRISATADILPSSHLSRKYLTGVWRSDPSGSVDGTLLSWLVSDSVSSTDHASPAPTTNAVLLVGAGSLADVNDEGTAV